ncbi:MAG: DUF924 family protein [Bacteriovoracaceae bacterium]
MRKLDWRELYHFWFDRIEITQQYYQTNVPRWFYGNNPAFDQKCKERFSPWLKNFDLTHFEDWTKTAEGYVTLIILLDQIPRNSFRGSKESFLYDPFARNLSLSALNTFIEHDLSMVEKLFLYLPLEHAESKQWQSLSVKKYQELNQISPAEIKEFTELSLSKAIEHQKSIEQYGRFPSRDKILGR